MHTTEETVTTPARRIFQLSSIRTRLLVIFVLLVLLPAAAISVGSAVGSLQGGRQQVINQLESVVTLKEGEISIWLQGVQVDLNQELARETALNRIIVLLQAMADTAEFQAAYAAQLADFQQTIELTKNFEELFLMDPHGRVVLSTNAKQDGKIQSSEAYFQQGLKKPYVTPPFYSTSLGQMSVVFAQPVLDHQGQVLGVLAGRVSMAKLSEIMGERAGLGETGQTYLVGSNYALLTKAYFDEEYVRSDGAGAAIKNRASGSGIYDDPQAAPVVGVYHWLPQLQVALLAEQHQSEAFRATYTTLGVGLGIALVAVAMAVVIGLVVTRSITNPLSSLAETSKQIAAGDLTARAQHIASGDEIGLLATNFNVMADRVTGLLKGLEERSRALETSAQVSRRLSTILDQGHLVAAVVEQVQQAFGYYHAHIYLIDEASGDLAMAGGTGEAGREMLARGHKIPRGKGLVGRAAETQAVVLVPDVSHEEGWLPNPLLPDTRSEIAVPILAGERVLGVLDVQQNVSGGLSETDADLLESIAGQVAVALHNTRLFAETRRKAEYEARLNLINQNVQRATSLESLLQVAARELGGALGAQRVSIQLAPSTDGDQLRK